jgi:phosphoglycerol transferase MdoB-like AlkP superfamily enzyme
MAILLLGPDEFEPLRNMQTTAKMFSSVEGIGLLLTGILGGAFDSLANILTTANLGDWKLWVFLYLAFSVGSNISLSPADLKGAATGFISLATVVLLLNLITLWMGDYVTRGVQFIGQLNGIFYSVMLIALMLSLIGTFLMFIILIFRRFVQR